jgi:hypothetical protein
MICMMGFYRDKKKVPAFAGMTGWDVMTVAVR